MDFVGSPLPFFSQENCMSTATSDFHIPSVVLFNYVQLNSILFLVSYI